jgi:hypothetical protein
MRLELLNIRDERVQSFLWQWLEPRDFRHDYTRLDAIKEVERQIYEGSMMLVGDMQAQVMLRVGIRNPKVVEPHIMGEGIKIRGAIEQGCLMAWERGFERVVIWTQHEPIARIVEKCGFRLDATIPALHMDSTGALCAMSCLSMESPHAL